MDKMKLTLIWIITLCLISPLIYAYSEAGLNQFDNHNTIVLEYSFSTPKLENIEIDGKQFSRVTIDHLENTFDSYRPCCPVQPVKILLPYKRVFSSISIYFEERFHLSLQNPLETGRSILPINTESIKRIDKPELTQATSNSPFSVVGTYLFRGYRILFVNLYPICYDEDSMDLYFYPYLRLEVKTDSSPMKSPLRGLNRDRSSIISMVDNPSYITSYDAVIPCSTESGGYIIITNEEFANSGLENNFHTLIQSKLDKGLNAEMVTVEDIVSNPDYGVNGTWGDNNPNNPFYQSEITEKYYLFDDIQARIRNFIRYAFLELGTEYVLLGGDADVYDEQENIVPCRDLFANESGLPLINYSSLSEEEEDDIPSDVYYACLDGNFNYDLDEHYGECASKNNVSNIDEADLLAEVYVGRACVDSEREIAHFVMKTLNYESATEEPYLKKILMVGEYLGFPGISAYGGNYKDLVIPFIPNGYNIDTLYDRDLPQHWTKYDMIDILNSATPHLINHDGHSYYGYNLKMTNSDVDALRNTKYFFLYSHGCNAGGFDNPNNYDCIGEHYTVETPYGAFAAILNARYGLGSENSLDSPSLALDKSFFKALFSENLRQLGRANHYSKEDHIWHIDDNGIRWVFYETNLLGDPEISIKDPSTTNIEINIQITTPRSGGAIYVGAIRLFSLPFLYFPVIMGKITIETEALSIPTGYVRNVEFLLDNISRHIDTEYPYEWKIDFRLLGMHSITAIARSPYGEKANDTIDTFTIILGG